MRNLHALCFAALCTLCVAAFGQAGDWITVNDPKDLADIYTNKTIRSMGWTGYYRADGRGFIVAPGMKPAGRKWFVKGGDQGCATLDSGATTCFRFQRHKDNRNLIRITDLAKGTNFTATVEEGIPDFEPLEKAGRS
ncbi:hypothetical protein [Ramlibacter sp. WS9]|uniref:hypothetical protein n=1 Tax=Ramlibacter sp. WS9 TaxID=1882741 RepID=UPI0011450D71|nr:hypothetical protein [Ramlibacter sp. WS9]ROZ62008.1 hypothetical protein EEB15_31735 [Ramlibacter sp. WS9]